MPRPERIESDLSAYLDGELEPDRARQIEALLARSSEARDQLDALRRTRDAVARLPRVTAPRDLRARVRRQIERRSLLEPCDRPRKYPRRLVQGLLAAAAVLVAAVGVWWVFGRRPATGPPIVRLARSALQTLPQADTRPPAVAANSSARAEAAPAGPASAAPAAHTPATLAPADRRYVFMTPASVPLAVMRPPAPAPQAHVRSASATSPRIELTVMPHDRQQYRAVRDVLTWWTRSPGRDGAARGPAATDDRPDATPQETSLASSSTPLRTRLLLDRLRAVAPDAVHVTVSFAPRDLDAIRAMIEPANDEPMTRLLALLESPQSVPHEPNNASTATPAPAAHIVRAAGRSDVYAMESYAPVRGEPLTEARPHGAKSATLWLTAAGLADPEQTALRWLEQVPEYARTAGETVRWTARQLFERIRDELATVQVRVRLLPPQPTTQPGGR